MLLYHYSWLNKHHFYTLRFSSLFNFYIIYLAKTDLNLINLKTLFESFYWEKFPQIRKIFSYFDFLSRFSRQAKMKYSYFLYYFPTWAGWLKGYYFFIYSRPRGCDLLNVIATSPFYSLKCLNSFFQPKDPIGWAWVNWIRSLGFFYLYLPIRSQSRHSSPLKKPPLYSRVV